METRFDINERAVIFQNNKIFVVKVTGISITLDKNTGKTITRYDVECLENPTQHLNISDKYLFRSVGHLIGALHHIRAHTKDEFMIEITAI